MARLPTTQGRRPVARPSRPMAQVSTSAAGAVGRAVEGLGSQVTQFGDFLAEHEATTIATERDTMVSDELRELLYNPETGYAAMQGQGAVDARQPTIEKLEGLKAKALDGLSGRARKKFESQLQRRIDGALNTVDRHALGQREVWLDGASAARVTAAVQDSLVDPSRTAESLRIITSETLARGVREGWDQARIDVELAGAKSGVYASQVDRIAASDPIAAMTYMRENQGSMLGTDIARLEQKLQPEVKRAIGRQRGIEASLDGVSSTYLDAIRTAESGGNDRARNPLSTASGRYQFIESTWRGLMDKYPDLGLTLGGRFDEAQQELAIRVFTADNAKSLQAAGIQATGGNLYAAHFLGAGDARRVLQADDGRALSSLLSDAVMRANPHLDGMTVSSFKAWANRKGGGSDIAFSEGASGVETLLDIQDPLEREAAINEYNLRAGVREGQRKAARAAAQDAAFQLIEAGTSIDQLSVDQRQSLGQEAMTSLRAYQRSKVSGVPVETDDATYYELRQMQASNPEAFKQLDMLAYRDKLDDADWQAMVDAQTKPASSITTVAASTLMTTALRQMKAAGLDTNADPGSDDAKAIAGLQSRLVRWQDDFVVTNGRAPTKTEMDAQIGSELVPVIIDPWGLGNKTEGSLAEQRLLELTPNDLAGSDITINGILIPAEEGVVKEQIEIMTMQGVEVTTGAVLDRLNEIFGSL